MANTTSQDVLNSFESTFQDKHILPTDLVEQWLLDCIGEYCLQNEILNYDKTTKEFDRELHQWQITTLGIMIKIKYCIREVSRINKLNNIIGKDISYNATGDSKKYSKAELDSEITRLTQLLEYQKPTAYV
jgi:hypothetical protein